MEIANLMSGLKHLRTVEGGKGATYDIFEVGDHYVVMNVSQSDPGSGNFNVVRKAAIDYVCKQFAGDKNVTSKTVWERLKRTKHPPSKRGPKAKMYALRVLYILVAIDVADHYRMVGTHGELHLSIKKPKKPKK
jgi:hypothetical protein